MEPILETSKSSFEIRTSVYEGPFELALELIEKRKLLVNDLSLASITDDFIQHVRAQATFPIEETTHFVGIAATLLLIKSKSLLPDLSLTEEEAEDVEELTHRLALYEKARDAARELSRLFARSVLVARGERAPEPIFAPSRDLSLAAMTEALSAVLAAREPPEAPLPETRVRKTISIEEMMDQLAARVQAALTLSFRDFSGHGKKDKVDVIVSFLALLELVKQGAVEAAQYEAFGDIRMSNTTSDTVPTYR
ncbi:MAG TPA: ScpA family protein [Candidatus Paceibacterota bacterium]|nr:ScpA family protein [Candidatus Paceibacterota bacterium]